MQVKCNLCGNTGYKILKKESKLLKLEKVRDMYGLSEVVHCAECTRCGFIYILPKLSLANSKSIYDEAYYDFKGRSGSPDSYYIEWAKREFLNIGRYAVKGKILDIGCGDGNMLFQAREVGWETYGIEPSNAMVRHCREDLKLNVVQGYFEEAIFPHDYFDCIVVSHVLGHVPDPSAFLDKAHDLLKTGGLLLLIVPNELTRVEFACL